MFFLLFSRYPYHQILDNTCNFSLPVFFLMSQHGHSHGDRDHDEVEEFYVSGDSATEESLYDLLSEDGSYIRKELEDIVAYMVSQDGVECRASYVENNQGKRSKKKKTLYFKGTRVGECFPNHEGHVTGTNDSRLAGLGNALINQNFCVEHIIVNAKERLMAPVENGVNTPWNPKGFYVWTSVAIEFSRQEPVCCPGDLIQVKGGLLRQRRRQTKVNNEEDGTNSSTSRSVKVDRVDAKSKSGLNWMNLFFLLLLFGPPLMMGGMWVNDFLQTNKQANEFFRSIGMSSSHRVRLTAFYDQHNPNKATTQNVDKMLKKYEGRELELFAKLDRKYEQLARKKKIQENAEEEDRKQTERSQNVED